MPAETSPVKAPLGCWLTFCAPQATFDPANSDWACAKNGKGTQTTASALLRLPAAATILLRRTWFSARLPCIFQLPTTTRCRMRYPAEKTMGFYPGGRGRVNDGCNQP